MRAFGNLFRLKVWQTSNIAWSLELPMIIFLLLCLFWNSKSPIWDQNCQNTDGSVVQGVLRVYRAGIWLLKQISHWPSGRVRPSLIEASLKTLITSPWWLLNQYSYPYCLLHHRFPHFSRSSVGGVSLAKDKLLNEVKRGSGFSAGPEPLYAPFDCAITRESSSLRVTLLKEGHARGGHIKW